MYNFVAIDFETANIHQNSACSIGVVKVVDSRIVLARIRGHATFYSLSFVLSIGLRF